MVLLRNKIVHVICLCLICFVFFCFCLFFFGYGKVARLANHTAENCVFGIPNEKTKHVHYCDWVSLGSSPTLSLSTSLWCSLFPINTNVEYVLCSHTSIAQCDVAVCLMMVFTHYTHSYYRETFAQISGWENINHEYFCYFIWFCHTIRFHHPPYRYNARVYTIEYVWLVCRLTLSLWRLPEPYG